MKKNFDDLVELARYLRSPDGCPWDRKQSLDSVTPYIIEEAFETVQAIELKDKDEIIEELGDLFFQVIFASQIASDEDEFDIHEVIDRLHTKLVSRHPHVFGDEKAKDAEEAIKIWHKQKLKEKSRKRRLLEIPRTMPSLQRAHRVGEKASQVGFDWKSAQEVLIKVKEEMSELEAEIKNNNKPGIEKEWGDLVFSLVNLGRHLKLDSEKTTHRAIDGFINRFSKVEDKAKQQGKELSSLTIEEMDELWEIVKSEEE